MKKKYFGQCNDEYVEVAYAPTARACCKKCKENIQKNCLKIGNSRDNDHFIGKEWYHLKCFNLKRIFADLDPEQHIFGLQKLHKEDCDEVINYLNQKLKKSIKKNEGKTKQNAKELKQQNTKSQKQKTNQRKNSKPAKKSITKTQVQSQNEDKKTLKNKAGKKKNLPQEKLNGNQSSQLKNQKRETRSKSKKQLQPSKLPKERMIKSVPKLEIKPKEKSVPKKKKQLKTKSVKKIKPKGYTKQQEEKFKELFQKYIQMTSDKLKAILAANSQSKTGNKKDLAEKCADGEILGKIPMCSACGGGKLRFDRKTGIYKCPGFMDDEDFRNCNVSYTITEIIRQPWIIP